METYKITTDRLSLRILDVEDREAFFKYRSLPAVYEYQSWKPQTLDEIDIFIEKNIKTLPGEQQTWLQLAICLDGGQLIGDIGLHFLDLYQIEIGYALAPEHQGKGYALEAVKGLIHYCFGPLKKHRISASVDPQNYASIKLLERVGFRKEAHFVKSFYMADQWYDDCVYALLEEEWLDRQ